MITEQIARPKPELKDIALADLRASKTNPRKVFKAIEELAESIKAQGIRQPILARPTPGAETPFEIIAGERRYRAALLALLSVVPCIVSEMSDREALEIQVVENLQREDLTELEEAESYQSMLNLQENGAACYTAVTLGARFGISESTIYKRLKLLELSENGRKALENGTLLARQAVLIGRIPDPVAREQALQQVLHPQHSQETLTYKETAALISTDFMRGLNGAPFKLTDATLVPAAGPCSTCPKMTDNCRHLFDAEEAKAFKQRKVCTDPGCFRAKVQAVWTKQTEEAQKEGMIVLTDRQSREIFPDHAEAGEMIYGSQYVLVGEKPDAGLLKPEVVDTVGTWRSLMESAEKETAVQALAAAREKVRNDPDLDNTKRRAALDLLEKNPPKGVIVPRLLARDQKGMARELVERSLAIVAIEQSGEPIFIGKVGSQPKTGGDDFNKQRKIELEAAKLRLAESLEGMTQMHAKLVANWQASPVWESLFEVAMRHAGADGLWLIGKWAHLQFGEHNSGKEDAVAKWAMDLPANERQALVPLLLIGQSMKYSGLGDKFEQVAQGAGLELDIAAIKRTAKAQIKGEKSAKKAKAKEPKAPKKSKAEKAAEAAAPFEWNVNGFALKPNTFEVDNLPNGVRCAVLTALHRDGKWRWGVDLISRIGTGRSVHDGVAEIGKGYKEASAATQAGFDRAVAFFKADPEVFKRVAPLADPLLVAEIESEGGVSPVTAIAAAAPVTTDPAILAQWVKAEAGGMPLEEIARSYGVTLADVEGALQTKAAEAPESPAKTKRSPRQQLTAELKQEVCRLHEAGRTGAEIAADLKISLPSVHIIKKEFGYIKPRLIGAVASEPAATGDAAPATSAMPAAQNERYAGLPASTHTAIDLINLGKTTHEIATGAGISLAEVIKLRQQLERDRAQEAAA